MRKVDEIEKIIAGYVGQFSHFVVDKQLKDMKVNRETISMICFWNLHKGP